MVASVKPERGQRRTALERCSMVDGVTFQAHGAAPTWSKDEDASHGHPEAQEDDCHNTHGWRSGGARSMAWSKSTRHSELEQRRERAAAKGKYLQHGDRG
jgi:hypothetical protein